MKPYTVEKVLNVRHWNHSLFTFSTTRGPTLRFENGHFLMVGLHVEGRPLLRAYSVASANYEEQLEFFSIKVPHGPLTSRLQHLAPGDSVLVGTKPTGTLLMQDLLPGKHLYLLSSGTGLAPFLSIIKDPATYERFDKVVLVHSVRHSDDLAYRDLITGDLPNNPYFGSDASEKLIYYPTVTRDPDRNRGRVTDLIDSGRLCRDIGLPAIDPATDRIMICGGADMLRDVSTLLDLRGMKVSPRVGVPGHYVFERAFADK